MDCTKKSEYPTGRNGAAAHWHHGTVLFQGNYSSDPQKCNDHKWKNAEFDKTHCWKAEWFMEAVSSKRLVWALHLTQEDAGLYNSEIASDLTSDTRNVNFTC